MSAAPICAGSAAYDSRSAKCVQIARSFRALIYTNFAPVGTGRGANREQNGWTLQPAVRLANSRETTPPVFDVSD
jgi:hypothetical protein